MAISIFRINYVNGSPQLDQNEDTGMLKLVYYDESIQDLAGGFSAMENVADPNQLQVLMRIEGDPVEMTAMKSDPRYTWIEDGAGWPE